MACIAQLEAEPKGSSSVCMFEGATFADCAARCLLGNVLSIAGLHLPLEPLTSCDGSEKRAKVKGLFWFMRQ